MLRNNLAKLMIDRGVTATQLFNDTGIARSTISKISNNNTDKISLQTIDKICNYLEVYPSEFFDFWAYDVKIQCGFDNFDTLSEVKEHWKFVPEFEEPCYLLLEFRRGRDRKYLLEYKFLYLYSKDPDKLFNPSQLDKVRLNGSMSQVAIFDDMPVQFKNELIDNIKQQLSETFEVWDISPTIKYIDMFIFNPEAE